MKKQGRKFASLAENTDFYCQYIWYEFAIEKVSEKNG